MGVRDVVSALVGSPETGSVTDPLAAPAPEVFGILPMIDQQFPGGGRMAKPLPKGVSVRPVSVNDSHGGELFGYKELQVNGRPMAAADVNIYGDEVSIRNIVTRPEARRKGLAKHLVDNLFDEFPDKRIIITGTTDEGTAFFNKTYNVAEDGTITRKPAGGLVPQYRSGGSF